MDGLALTQSERELAYHTLRSFSDRPNSVGALVEQVEGKRSLAVERDVRHVPEHASEGIADAEIIDTYPERFVRKSERPHRV